MDRGITDTSEFLVFLAWLILCAGFWACVFAAIFADIVAVSRDLAKRLTRRREP